MNQKCCTTCDRVDVNEMTDERYCSLKDYAQIKLRWHKYRPDWCPKLKKKRRASDDESRSDFGIRIDQRKN